MILIYACEKHPSYQMHTDILNGRFECQKCGSAMIESKRFESRLIIEPVSSSNTNQKTKFKKDARLNTAEPIKPKTEPTKSKKIKSVVGDKIYFEES